MNGSMMAAFWGVSMLFVIIPGADWAYALSAGIHRVRVAAAVCGMLSGHMTATLIVAAGVAAVLAGSPPAMTGLTIAGAVYLMWLGHSTLRKPGPHPTGRHAPAGNLAAFARGAGISLLNPKVLLLFLALLPQFIDPHAPWPAGVQMMTLGALHVVNCAAVYFLVAFGAAAALGNRPKAARIMTTVSGAAVTVFGLILVIEAVVRHL
jgi:threonine/homoserine/homoserine lactone efflux protein